MDILKFLRRNPKKDHESKGSPPTQMSSESNSSAQSVTASPTLSLWASIESMTTINFHMEFQMTIQTKIERLTRKQATILATSLAVESLIHGVDTSGYMVMEWLLSFLTHNQQPEYLRNTYERRACMLLSTVLSWCYGNWMDLQEREKLPDHVTKSVPDEWLPNPRTYQSWKQTYDVRKFFKVRIVPLNTLIENRTSNTERYSSYTKGYGNGGHRSPTLKTPYSSELDGDSIDRDPPEIPLEDFNHLNQLLLSIEKAKAEKNNK